MGTEPAVAAPGAILSLEEAQTIVDQLEGWVDWEYWKLHNSPLSLDGEFTFRELSALLMVMESRSAHVPTP